MNAQNWFAVALDFVIVFVGVFVGLQANNWNAAGADCAVANSYPERIAVYLSADLDDCRDQSAWELLLAYFQAGQVAEFSTTGASWDEMRSAGDLRLNGNPALGERPAYREHVRGRIPDDIQAYISDRCYECDTSGFQRIIGCASPVDEATARAVIDAIARDEALMRELRYWLSTMIIAGRIGIDRVGAATEVKAAVEAELAGAR